MIGINHVKIQHLISLPVELAVEDQLSLEMYILVVYPKALYIPEVVAKFKLLFVFVRVLYDFLICYLM